MREILFRGKTLNDNEWVEGFYVNQFRAHEIYCLDDSDYSHVDPLTVGQYTGLSDKNGKKIFEGDIIKIVPYYDYSDDYSISKVYSYNGIFCVDYHGDDFDSTALGFLKDYLPDGDFEVIGNIHDNPELVEVSE